METFILEAEPRADLGKGASRRLRHAGKVPAIIYGAEKDPEALTLGQNDLLHHVENEAFFSHILTVKVGKDEQQAIVKDMQRHPHKLQIMHLDLQRVSANQAIRVSVPLHYLNEENSPGVKEGGLVNHHTTEVEVQCLPKNLPEYIEVDMGDLELDGIVHLTDIKLPSDVELVELTHGQGHDQAIAIIHMPRAVVEEVDEVEGEVEGEADSASEESADDDEEKS